jgi:hypothetical protein
VSIRALARIVISESQEEKEDEPPLLECIRLISGSYSSFSSNSRTDKPNTRNTRQFMHQKHMYSRVYLCRELANSRQQINNHEYKFLMPGDLTVQRMVVVSARSWFSGRTTHT